MKTKQTSNITRRQTFLKYVTVAVFTFIALAAGHQAKADTAKIVVPAKATQQIRQDAVHRTDEKLFTATTPHMFTAPRQEIARPRTVNNDSPATKAATSSSTPTATKSVAITNPVANTPSPVPAPTGSDIATEAQCPGQGSLAATNTVLVCMTSVARQAHGLNAISGNTNLMAAAAAKADDMKTCGYSHTACGRTFNYWIGVKGYTIGCQAENIAMGQRSPGEVFKAWMNSSGHRANILGPSYYDVGVAQLAGNNGPLWVMMLGGC